MVTVKVVRGGQILGMFKTEPAWNYFCLAAQCGGTQTNFVSKKDLGSNSSSTAH